MASLQRLRYKEQNSTAGAGEFGENVHLHLRLTGAFQVMQEHIAHPVGECRSLPPRDALKRGVLALRFAIDHCILRLEATLGLVSSLAYRLLPSAVVMRMYSVAVRFAMRFP